MRRRSALLVIVAVALVITIKPLLRGEVFTFRDHFGYFQPMRWHTALELRHLTLPLWNPYNASGEPWLANPQTGVFYPPQWLFAFLPFATAYMLFLLLHILLLGGGALLLFARRVRVEAALAGAVGLMVAGPALSLLDVTNNYTTFAWLPLVLWCGLTRASVRTSACVIALSFLAGEPFFAAIGALLFVLLRRDWRASAATAIAAFALSAVQLLPFLELVRGSDRTASIAREQVFRDSMYPTHWLRIILPPQMDASGFDPNLFEHFIPVVYCGVIVVVLALIALATSLRRRDARAWLGLLAVVVITSAGWFLPPVEWLFAHLPVTLFRYPARLVPLGALAVAALAALGWEWIAARSTWRWLTLAVVTAIAADGLIRSAPLLASAPFTPQRVPYDARLARGSKFIRLPGASWSDRAAWMDGYLNLFDRRFDAWTAAPLATARYTLLYEDALLGARLEMLDQMSVGYLVGTQHLGRPFVPLARAGRVTVYRNPHALPMAYWLGDDGRFSRPTFLSLGSSFAHIDVEAPSAGVVVLTQQGAPGWRVAVDGKASSPLLRDGLWRSVRVPAGHHVIDWTYRPASLMAGAICTLLALAWCVLSSDRAHESFFRARRE
jgi:hypothetical protein